MCTVNNHEEDLHGFGNSGTVTQLILYPIQCFILGKIRRSCWSEHNQLWCELTSLPVWKSEKLVTCLDHQSTIVVGGPNMIEVMFVRRDLFFVSGHQQLHYVIPASLVQTVASLAGCLVCRYDTSLSPAHSALTSDATNCSRKFMQFRACGAVMQSDGNVSLHCYWWCHHPLSNSWGYLFTLCEPLGPRGV